MPGQPVIMSTWCVQNLVGSHFTPVKWADTCQVLGTVPGMQFGVGNLKPTQGDWVTGKAGKQS